MREADIRPAPLLAEYLRLSAADAQRVLAAPDALAPRACPGCASRDSAFAFTKNGFDLVRCATCGTLYVNPCPTAAALAELYRDSVSSRYWADVFFPAVAEVRRERIFRPRVRRALEFSAVPPASIIDVGAGAGIFLEECRAAVPGARLRAVEPGGRLAALCRQKGFEVFEGFVDAAAESDWRASADLVVCFEVIEHTSDTLGFVRSLGALAKPGGLVLVSGLCGSGFDIQALGARSNAVAPPHHLTFLSHRGASSLLEKAGLEEVAFLTPGELDVDIVRNALQQDDQAVSDPFIRSLVQGTDDTAKREFQAFLVRNRLSSHMWIVARRPVACR